MKDSSTSTINLNIKAQRAFFATQQTKDIKFRLTQLKILKQSILKHQTHLETALWQDLHKSPEEAYLTEINIVISEIDYHLKKLRRWSKDKRVSTPLHLLPSRSKIVYEPLGIALIIAPWNYPFQLLINSLVGAISAGCCSIIKPSPDTPTVAAAIQNMIEDCFAPEYIACVQGGREVNTVLFNKPFDIIFFTGSPKVGKIVMESAAKHLTPVVLELGGKSPCIVDADANINVAAKRIAWGKLINAGQTCIAPDYLLAHESIKEQLLDRINWHIKVMYGENIKESRFYPRIVNIRAMHRLQQLLTKGKIHSGGDLDIEQRFIAPTIIDEISPDDPVMQEEIFGPILPVMGFSTISEALNYVNTHDKPLAFYYFGKNRNAKTVLAQSTSGGACINDTLMHITNHKLPFGGVGTSGMGKYHGRESFLAFSNQRAVVSTPTWIDLPLKYVPFTYFKWVKKII